MKDFYVSKSHVDNVAIADDILQGVVNLNRDHATLIGLSGDLGSGKTTFTKGLVESLSGQADDVQSPTFVLMRDYDLADNVYNFKSLHHLDVYRLKTAKELLTLKLENEFDDPANLIVIEWWQKVKSAIPKSLVKSMTVLSFETINEYTRTVSVN